MRVTLELDFEVEADYQPMEAATPGFPGCDESITVTQVTLNGVDVAEAVRADSETLALFEDEAMAYYRDQHERREAVKDDAHDAMIEHGKRAHFAIFGNRGDE
jgi:hypothetical protein